MSEDLSPRVHLARAERSNRAPEDRIADALTGLLSAVVEMSAKDSREEFLEGKWDECDAALGRVLEVAEELEEQPNSMLKPTAFSDLAARIREAVNG